MRLLHFDSLDNLILTDFRGKAVPPYAILSHRWSGSEILFDDVRSGAYRQKVEGYRKLEFCARQAAQDDLQYFWIDTCCIDKWNLSELSKAINSMFKWYRNASRCYVYLSDVSVPIATDSVQSSDWESSFRNSVWFTRGWTLQELIAPLSVEFFSCEGRRIGDKASLDQLIHTITDIPLAALRNCPLDEFSTSERRRWTIHRETTEGEDIVYCLLGVLGVSMPTAYGEGLESAQRRLQIELEEIGSAPTIIPFSRNDSFVGCEAELASLEAKLFNNNCTTTTLAIVGPGGIGKSQLALEVAHRTKHKDKKCQVYWMDASDKASLCQSYANVAEKLHVAGSEDDQADIKQIIKRCVRELEARKCLMIFDNAKDIILQSGGSSTTEAAALTDFLPWSKMCSVIFTTMESDLTPSLDAQNVVVLHKLESDTALSMLQSQLARPLSGTQRQEAELLVRELSCLPLAIVQAAAYMSITDTTVREYRVTLGAYKEVDLDHKNDFSEAKLRGSGVKDPVVATLSVSLEHISRCHASATDYLSLAACVHRRDISLDLLETTLLQSREHSIKLLAKYALVIRRPAESALDVHQLVHQALRKQLHMTGMLRHWTQCAATTLLRVFPDDDHGNRSKRRRLLPHAQFVLSSIQDDDSDKVRQRLAWKCVIALYSDGRYREAEELGIQVMQMRKRVLGDEHLDTLLSINQIVLIYIEQGRWKDAEELAVKLLNIRKRLFGESHHHTLTSMANLSLIYIKQGLWKQAEELGAHVVQMRKRMLGWEHRETLISMANLASTYGNQGRWKEAEELNMQVTDARKKVLGQEHPDTLTSMHNLAWAYWQLGRWKEAEELNLQVTITRREVLGDEHPDTLISMGNLASTYRRQGRWSETEELLTLVVQTQKRVLSSEHPDTMASLAGLASTYSDQGRWKEAEELNLQVVELRKRVSGDEHPDTLTSMSNLATTYMNQGQWDQAEELEMQVIQTRKNIFGSEHPDTLISLTNLASTYSKQGRWQKAEELDVQLIDTRKKLLGQEHPDTLTSMHNLASTYWKQGQYAKAEQLGRQVVQLRERVLGVEHHETLASMANLALTFSDQRRWKEAKELNMQVLDARRRLLGGEHPDTLISVNNLASTYYQQGQWKEAEALYMQVSDARKRVLGHEHPETLISMGNLASTYWQLGRWNEAEKMVSQVAETKKRVLGDEHSDTLISISSLASIYWHQQRWKKAEELCMQVKKTRQKVLGDEHPDTLSSMAGLAWMYWKQEHREEARESGVQLGRAEEAIALMEKCFIIRQRVLGDQHPHTQSSHDMLNSWRAEKR